MSTCSANCDFDSDFYNKFEAGFVRIESITPGLPTSLIAEKYKMPERNNLVAEDLGQT